MFISSAFLNGVARLSVICADEGRFLSECVKQHMPVRNIHKKDDVTYEFTVSREYLDKVWDIAEKFDCEVNLVYEKSFFSHILRYRRRRIFAVGFILCLFILMLSTSFITDISVEGNKNLSSEEILTVLSEAGFSKGDFRYGIDVRQIQHKSMILCEDLSWIWIDIHGTKAVVSVRERVEKPIIEDKLHVTNTVAVRDALVTELMPRSGKPVATVGDVVREGDILISGMYPYGEDKISYMRGEGIVRGRTWYEAEGEYHHTRTDRYMTGNIEKRLSVDINGYVLPIFKDKITSFEVYDHLKNTKKLNFFKKTLPISFTIDTYCEIIEKYTNISDEEVVATAVKSLEKDLTDKLAGRDDLTIISKNHKYEKLPNGNMYVKVYFECSENIGRIVPVDISLTQIKEQEEQ